MESAHCCLTGVRLILTESETGCTVRMGLRQWMLIMVMIMAKGDLIRIIGMMALAAQVFQWLLSSEADASMIDIHDWEIVGVVVNRDEHFVELSLYFPDQDKRKTLRLGGVKQFFVSGMRLQNVILDAMIFEKLDESSYLKYCFEVLKVDEKVFSRGSGYKIVYLEPSVGAELACCCTDVSWHDLVAASVQ